jgi:hypothetical protein
MVSYSRNQKHIDPLNDKIDCNDTKSHHLVECHFIKVVKLVVVAQMIGLVEFAKRRVLFAVALVVSLPILIERVAFVLFGVLLVRF